MKTTSHMVEKEIDDRAVLVSLVTQKQKKNELLAEYSLQELVKLAETAGVHVLETMTQNKETKDSKWFIGKGKVEELKLAFRRAWREYGYLRSRAIGCSSP